MMKKLFSFLVLSVFSVLALFGCGKDRDINDIKNAYSNMVSSYAEEKKQEYKFFSDKNSPNSIVISYPVMVRQAINSNSPSNAVQKRYRALYYQQKILDNIFIYYNNHQEEFYRIAESQEIEKDELNDLYNRVCSVNESLKNFESHYSSFISATEDGVSDIMEFNITSYSYNLNHVIDCSFDFIYKFHDLYVKYCVENYGAYSESNLNTYVDKAYVDISYIVYLENIKSFNYSVGSHGVCDLSDVVGSQTEYNLLSLLEERKPISTTIVGNVGLTSDAGVLATDAVNLFTYSRDVFEQRLTPYISTYSSVNMYNLNQYKYGLNGSVNYESYLKSLSASDRATIALLNSFVEDNFSNYISKLNSIVN
jgi:hypothetical protein